MRVPQSFLEGFLIFLFLIPLAMFYAVKWLVKGIILLAAELRKT